MDFDLAALRRRVAALGTPSQARRYPEDLRAELCAAANALRGSGRSVADVSVTLGVPWETLSRWIRLAPVASSGSSPKSRGATFRTVEIAPAITSSAPEPPGLIVHGPCGLRIEVRDVAALAALLRCLP